MDYTEVEFFIKPSEEGRDICLAFLSQLPFETFQESPKGLIAFIQTEQFSEADIRSIIQLIPNHEVSFEFKTIERINWNEQWEKNFKPLKITDDCYVRAPFHEAYHAKYEIVIMPKMSFGTGHHATTTLMLRFMLGEPFEGKSVLDAGCGTAILAIMAEKLLAKSVLAYDIDDWAVENSIENIRVNNCKNIDVEKGSVHQIAREGFDVILANINKNVLLDEMSTYSKKLNPNGLIFLSGFYESDIEDVISCAEQSGLKHIAVETLNEWAVLKLQKRLD